MARFALTIYPYSLCTLGIAMVTAGFVLDFPNFGQTRDQMQLAHLVHVAGGFVLIAVAFDHIYIGTLGTEGAFEGMAKGRVDVEWAKQHHDLRYQELVAKGVMPELAGAGQRQPPPAAGVFAIVSAARLFLFMQAVLSAELVGGAALIVWPRPTSGQSPEIHFWLLPYPVWDV